MTTYLQVEQFDDIYVSHFIITMVFLVKCFVSCLSLGKLQLEPFFRKEGEERALNIYIYIFRVFQYKKY